MPFLEQSLGGLVVDLADEDLVDVDDALVHAGAHPHLQLGVERVVGHRTLFGRIHLRVRPVHRATECRLLLRGALSRDRQVGECRARPLDGWRSTRPLSTRLSTTP